LEALRALSFPDLNFVYTHAFSYNRSIKIFKIHLKNFEANIFAHCVLFQNDVLTWKATRNYSTKHQYKTNVGHTKVPLPS